MSPMGVGVRRDRHCLDDVLPGDHTEDAEELGQRGWEREWNENLVLDPVSNDKAWSLFQSF